MSRNAERLGLEKKAKNIDTPPAGGALEFVVPTEFVDLPSKGLFYPEGHLLHNVDSVEIKQMTAKEEDILTNKSFLKKGIVFDRLLANLLVNKGIKTDSLLVGDRNALILAARISGYGEVYDTNVVCPLCLTSNKVEYHLAEILPNNWEEQIEESDIELDNEGLFTVTLPQSKVVVKTRPMSGTDEKTIGALKDGDSVTGQLKSYVVSINEETNKKVIARTIDKLPARDAKYLRTVYKRVNPNLDFRQGFACENCGHEAELEVRLGPDFFWFES
jgi:hypothetical protein